MRRGHGSGRRIVTPDKVKQPPSGPAPGAARTSTHPIGRAILAALDIDPDVVTKVVVVSLPDSERVIVETCYWNPLIMDIERVVRAYTPNSNTEAA